MNLYQPKEIFVTLPHYGTANPYIGDENNLQKSTARILAAKYPDIWAHAFHVPNGGKRPKSYRRGRGGVVLPVSTVGRELKLQGTKPGVADWVILLPTESHPGAVIELKVKGGTLQGTQVDFLYKKKVAGYFVAVCWSTDGFEGALRDFLGRPCSSTCDQGDHHPGGKCDRLGCYAVAKQHKLKIN